MNQLVRVAAESKVKIPLNPLPVLTNTDLPSVINTVFNVVLIFLFLVAFSYLVYGGAQFLTSGGDAQKVTNARNTVIYAIIGVVIIALSYVLLNWVIGLLK